jgi:hypothetical protein
MVCHDLSVIHQVYACNVNNYNSLIKTCHVYGTEIKFKDYIRLLHFGM